MATTIDHGIVEATLIEASAQGRDPADVPLEDVARRAGLSRATLYRRIGSRRALDDAVRAAGVDPGGRPAVRERATEAALTVIVRDGLGAMTLEAVAAQAGCSLPALYDQFGGREGLLTALFERYSPIRRFEALLETPPASLAEGVRGIYAAAFDAATAQPKLAAALIAEALTRPHGPIASQVLGLFAPRALGLVRGWLAAEVAAGRCRPLPIPLLVQLLVGPMFAHVATRDLSERVIGEPPAPREEVIETLTAAYCRAVALPPPTEEDLPRPPV
jgi:AcrR family transcriptional regulator